MELQTAKGVKDVLPEEQLLRQKVISTLKKVFEKYGFAPLETPIIERFETLSAKYAGGAEILKETFQLEDQGKRPLGLRYDLTVPFCRFVGMNPNLKMPFKRYEIGKVFRDGPVASDRVREFTQCDVDVVGAKSMLAEAEFINIYNEAFNELGIKFELRVNNRKLLNGIVETAGIKSNAESIILTIDKLDKMGEKGVKTELEEKDCGEEQIKTIFKLINTNKLSDLKKLIKSDQGLEGIKELEELFSYCKGLNLTFVPSLARGLAYYTGTIFEVYAVEGEIKSAIGSGGRYDKMIGAFLENKQDYPAVGVSFGLDRICMILKNKEVGIKTPTQVYIIPIKTIKEASEITQNLRSEGIKADIDLNEKGISKNLDYANSYGIPYVLFVGEKELKEKKVKLRDMKTGKEELLSLKDVIKKLK